MPSVLNLHLTRAGEWGKRRSKVRERRKRVEEEWWTKEVWGREKDTSEEKVHRGGKRSVDRNKGGSKSKRRAEGGKEKRRRAKFDLDSGQETWRKGGMEKFDRLGKRGKEKDSGILVKVSSLCIACCAIPPL